MTDLHSHVLFDIDDGARNIDESIDILLGAARRGVKRIIATPHFSVGDDVEEFVRKRDERMEELISAAEELGIGIELKAGAEVYITDEIFTEDKLEQLALGDSRVILAEFSYYRLTPETFLEYIDEILSMGLKVLLAHPERYAYLVRNRRLLEAVLDRGVMLQINAVSLYSDGEEGDFARMAVGEGIATVIGSDTHHPHSRRLDAIGEVGRTTNEAIRAMLETNPDKIFEEMS